ncbi:hypothetical protein BJV78DRAFT_1286987 [Lactifluus subvellereus]|nr:hypothetical protein BJV78DRAFT_1286987 [Lactifluus subvellereus]
MNRLLRELKALRTSPQEVIRVRLSKERLLDVVGIIEAQDVSTRYFLQRAHHTMERTFAQNRGRDLRQYPNPDSALDEEAGKLLEENYESYCELAKLITSVSPPEFTTQSAPADAPDASTPISTPLPSAPSLPYMLPPPVFSPQKGTVTATTVTIPLQHSSSNTLLVSSSLSSLSKAAGGNEKDGHVSPAPLGTADSNVSPVINASATVGPWPFLLHWQADPARVSLNALAGEPLSNVYAPVLLCPPTQAQLLESLALPAIMPEFVNEVCPRQTVIDSRDIIGALSNTSAVAIPHAWIDKLGGTEDQCIDTRAYPGQIFDLSSLYSSR